MIKQHYGNDLGMSYEDMENAPFAADSNLPNRYKYTRHSLCRHKQGLPKINTYVNQYGKQSINIMVFFFPTNIYTFTLFDCTLDL